MKIKLIAITLLLLGLLGGLVFAVGIASANPCSNQVADDGSTIYYKEKGTDNDVGKCQNNNTVQDANATAYGDYSENTATATNYNETYQTQVDIFSNTAGEAEEQEIEDVVVLVEPPVEE
jgi:hypothetical protein